MADNKWHSILLNCVTYRLIFNKHVILVIFDCLFNKKIILLVKNCKYYLKNKI